MKQNFRKKLVDTRFNKHFDNHLHHNGYGKHNRKGKQLCGKDKVHKHFQRYHRFFLFSPLFWLAIILYLLHMNSQSTNQSIIGTEVVFYIIGFIIVKEIVSFTVSRRIYKRILKPIETLRDGMESVAKGKYDSVEAHGGFALQSLIVAFNQMTDELRLAEELKAKYELNRKELVANISHDLKTPITSINGYVDGIVDGVANTAEKQERYIQIIQQNAKYMNRLIDDLILYSKLDVQKIDFDFRDIDFTLYVEDLYNEMSLELEEQGCTLELNNQVNGSMIIPIDGQHLTRAIRNIVSNAVKYNDREQSKIKMDLIYEHDRVELCIQDNGPGILEDKLKSIFDRFYRVDNARTTDVGGSGLGLAIAKEIVSAHGGTISARSQLGLGTTICIQLYVQRKDENDLEEGV